jgi:hypothetical protein
MLTAGSQPQRFRRRGGELCHPEAAFRPKDLSEESRQRIDHPEATFFDEGSAVDFRRRVVTPDWTA